jgi:hypothetical protein
MKSFMMSYIYTYDIMKERERESLFSGSVLGVAALKLEFERQTCHPGLLHNLLLFSENFFFVRAAETSFIVCYEFDSFMKLLLIAHWDGIPTSSCE